MKKSFSTGLVFLLSITALFSQSSFIKNVSIASWKNNAKGAYSIFHDDFCMETSKGIETYADTIAYNRNIPIAFAIVTGECSNKEWKQAKKLCSHGHEITNHSHNHYCGLPVEWCPRETYSRNDYKVQFDLSQKLIEEKTGTKANLYVFPYDLFDETMINYLRDTLKMGGSRSGIQDRLNHPDSIQPFKIQFHILRPEYSMDSLNGLAQQAIDQGKWAVRGAHGVEDTSWGTIPLKAYQNHFDFLQKKIATNELWVATPSTILNYSLARYATSVASERIDGTNKTKINIFNQGNTPDTELTLLVNLSKVRTTKYIIKQGNKFLKYRLEGEQLIFNCQSDGGAITLE